MSRPASKSFLRALRASDRKRARAEQPVPPTTAATAPNREILETKKPAHGTSSCVTSFSTADWSDIYDALMDAVNQYHSGPRADRICELARKIHEEKLALTDA